MDEPGVEYQKAVQLSIPIVQPDWVFACFYGKKFVLPFDHHISRSRRGSTLGEFLSADPYLFTEWYQLHHITWEQLFHLLLKVTHASNRYLNKASLSHPARQPPRPHNGPHHPQPVCPLRVPTRTCRVVHHPNPLSASPQRHVRTVRRPSQLTPASLPTPTQAQNPTLLIRPSHLPPHVVIVVKVGR
jgi:hypothetical protein